MICNKIIPIQLHATLKLGNNTQSANHNISQLQLWYATMSQKVNREEREKEDLKLYEACAWNVAQIMLCLCMFVRARVCAYRHAAPMLVCPTNYRVSDWIGAMTAVIENTVVVIEGWGSKTINVCIRFIKCNPCTEWLHLVLFRFITLFWSLVKCSANTCWLKSIGLSSTFQTNLFTTHQLPSGIILTRATNKHTHKKSPSAVAQTLSLTEPNPANHVWVSWLFFHFILSHQE